STGQTAQGPAHAQGPAADRSNDMDGTVSGGIQGRHLDFTIHWAQGPVGRYTGDVGDDGFVHNGSTYDQANPESHSGWSSASQLGCVVPPAAPASPAAPPPASTSAPAPTWRPPATSAKTTATVTADVDVYDAP